MITAEECFNNFVDFEICPLKDYTSKELINDTKLAMIEFARLHTEQALKIASEEVYHDIQIDWCDPYDYSAGHNGIKGVIAKESILNAYPLENIK